MLDLLTDLPFVFRVDAITVDVERFIERNGVEPLYKVVLEVNVVYDLLNFPGSLIDLAVSAFVGFGFVFSPG